MADAVVEPGVVEPGIFEPTGESYRYAVLLNAAGYQRDALGLALADGMIGPLEAAGFQRDALGLAVTNA